jgi:hypothetical protein
MLHIYNLLLMLVITSGGYILSQITKDTHLPGAEQSACLTGTN